MCRLLFLFLILASCKDRSLKREGFVAIDEKLYRDQEKLVTMIVPNETYSYWEYVFVSPTKSDDKILKRSGDSLLKISYALKRPSTGFFTSLAGYYYIVYVRNDQKGYITGEDGLKRFIGKVNNLEEALLISKINGLWLDHNEMRASSYKKTSNGYELNLGRFEDCPVKFESMRVCIDSMGKLQFRSTGVYYEKPNECIMY